MIELFTAHEPPCQALGWPQVMAGHGGQSQSRRSHRTSLARGAREVGGEQSVAAGTV